MTKQRIAVIAHNYYPGGVREQREIDALVDAGYVIDLICLRDSGQNMKEIRVNLQIYRVPIFHKRSGIVRYILEYLLFFIASFLIISLLQIKHNHSLVQVHNIPDFLVFAAFLPKLRGARVLLDIRDPMPETFQYKFNLPEEHKLIALMRFIERISIKFSDHILTVHEPLRKIHIQRGCPEDKISVIRNLPDERIFKSVYYADWPRSKSPELTLVYTGTIGKRHGLQTAIRGLKLLVDEIPNIKLRIIGDGEYISDLNQLVKMLNLTPYVAFEPPVPNTEIPSVLTQSDIGICLQEGLFGEIAFPTKVPEYFAMATPAIVSKTSITSASFSEEMVEFVPPGDWKIFAEKVMHLHNNPDRAKSLIINGYRFLDNNNWHTEKEQYLKVIKKLVHH